MAVLPSAAFAVTVTLKAEPAVADAGVLTVKYVTASALTVIAALVPVIDVVTVSVAVIVWLPRPLNVAENMPAPSVSVASTGRLPAPSVLVKWTVPV